MKEIVVFWLRTSHEPIMGKAGFRFALKTVTNLTIRVGLGSAILMAEGQREVQ